MKAHVFLSILLTVCSFGCGGAPDLDVSEVSGRFGGKNPVGALYITTDKKLVFESGNFCTAFVTELGLVSNAHCIHQDGKRVEPDDLKLLLKNPNDGKTSQYEVSRILDYRYQDEEDWVLLESEDFGEIFQRFGAVDFHREVPSIEKLKEDLNVEVIRVNPPEAGSSNTAKLSITTAKAMTGLDYLKCTIPKPGQELTYDKEKIQSEVTQYFSSQKSALVSNAEIRPGNSGSPVFLGDKVIGIIYKYSGTGEPGRDAQYGHMQWVPGVKAFSAK